MSRQDEEVPYRATITSLPGEAQVDSKDEENYDTLRIVQTALAESIEDLSKNFNAFDIDEKDLPADRAKKLLHDIETKQGVYDIVSPLLEIVNNAVRAVDNKYKDKQR